VAFHLHRALVEQGDVADNGKAQTGSAGVMAPAAVNTVESFKDAIQVFRGNADPLVFY
jgi:hypothetical protein